jgi:hypothetical protein
MDWMCACVEYQPQIQVQHVGAEPLVFFKRQLVNTLCGLSSESDTLGAMNPCLVATAVIEKES